MLKCAFYEKEITPPLECEIPGYFNPRPAEDVTDRLYVKAVVFENDGKSIAMIAADACGLSMELCEKITARVERMTGIEKENILVCATHSHTGIPTGSYTMIRPDEIYLDVFCRLAADCVTLAQKRLVPAKIKYAKAKMEGLSFVRNYRMKDGSIRTNPGRNNPNVVGPYDKADPDYPVLIAYDEQDKPLGAITNFACHLDCVMTRSYSGDYASWISHELKKEFGNDFVSFFMMGTAGNVVDSNALSSEPLPKNHYTILGKELARGAIDALGNSEVVENPVVSSKKAVLTLKRRTITEEELRKEEELSANKEIIYAQSEDRSLGARCRGYIAERTVCACKDKTKTRDFVVQVISIGDCKFYGISGEIYVKFGRDIKANAPTEKVFIATVANGNNGYIPTPDLFNEEKMYEIQISSAPFDADTGDKIVNKLKEIQ